MFLVFHHQPSTSTRTMPPACISSHEKLLQAFQPVELSEGASAFVNHSKLPREIARSLLVGCVDEIVFSLRHVIIGNRAAPRTAFFKVWQTPKELIGSPIPACLLGQSTPDATGQSAHSSTWELLGFQSTAHGLGPPGLPEKRRIIALGCSYETTTGIGYPYLFVMGNQVVISLLKRSSFRLRSDDHFLFVG